MTLMVTKNRGTLPGRGQQVTAESLLMAWEQEFRADFASDDGASLERCIRRIGIETSPNEMLEGTVDLVAACVAMSSLDGVKLGKLLADQCYGARSSAGTYALIVDLFGRSSARLLVRPDMGYLDLADLCEFSWERLRLAGFKEIWLIRIDGADLSSEEIANLEQIVSNDIRFDYGEDEMSIIFDPDTYPGALSISVCQSVAD